ncbi:E3 ubiquitin-protein ligase [Salix suchowensis]|nr:E3 ubiquitin-protein ligase [Salix suchowensis]
MEHHFDHEAHFESEEGVGFKQKYKSIPAPAAQQPSCPVCKADISPTSLVPLYGRGPSSSKSMGSSVDAALPRRPLPSGLNTVSTNTSRQSRSLIQFFQSTVSVVSTPAYFHDPHGGYAAMSSSVLGGTVMTGFFKPMMGMFNEIGVLKDFGTSVMNMFAHPYTNPLTGSNNPRMRRQEIQLDKSLNRVSIFLLCCFVLCLLLF